MHVGTIGTPLEATDEELTLLRDAIIIRIRELPDTWRRSDIECTVGPARTLRDSQAIRKDRAPVVHAVAIAVFQHDDATRLLFLVLADAPRHAWRVADKEPAARIDASQGGMSDHPGGDSVDKLKARRKLSGRSHAGSLPLRQGHLDRTSHIGRNAFGPHRFSGGRGGGLLGRRRGGRPLFSERTQRMQLVTTHEHLGGFGLQQDTATAGFALEGAVHEDAVGIILQRVALGDDLKTRPFTERRFDIGTSAVT